jgi:hypothetical protein
LVGAARSESAAAAARYEDSRRARISISSVSVNTDTFRPGHSPRIIITLENVGSNTANYWASSEYSVVASKFTKTLLSCNDLLTQRWPITRSATMSSTWNSKLTESDYALIMSGTHKLIVTGSLCWQEPGQPVRRWFYCYELQTSGDALSCDTGNGPG